MWQHSVLCCVETINQRQLVSAEMKAQLSDSVIINCETFDC